MGGVPKKKPSKTRIRKRKSVWANSFNIPEFALCPQCNQPKLPHRVCENCGYYGGKKVIDIKEATKKES